MPGSDTVLARPDKANRRITTARAMTVVEH
jgi:hypothetical protein